MDSLGLRIAEDNPHLTVDWGVAQRVCQGEAVCGDRPLVSVFPGGVLLAVVDGLGHGQEAAKAADIAVAAMQSHPSEPVDSLIKRCHQSLRRTRGAALSLASYSETPGMVSWLGVGNVEGVLIRASRTAAPPQENIMLFSGVVGHNLPILRVTVTPVHHGDLLVFFSDGVCRDFLWTSIFRQEPRHLAETICSRFHKAADDASVLVARFTGGPL